MKGNRFKQDNRGASLLAVLVLMVVVSLIAVVITKITIVNIEMKEVERGTKKNFYSADELMDNLRAGARELAEQSLEKAYADVLENYLTYSASGGDVQKVFATRYMDGLQKQFAENHTDPAVGASDTMDASGNVAYRVSGYDTDTVKSCIKEAADQGCYIPAADPKYEVDYGAGTFTLKGVQIRYKDAQDYETTIKTDLVFSTPKMNFSGSGQVQEFMRYALIADRQINIGAQNVTVDGNVYAFMKRGRRNLCVHRRKRYDQGEDGSYTRGYRDGERIRPDGRGRQFLDLGGKYKDIVCRDKRCFLYPYERKYVCGG